jgi:hypothetical protein
MGVPALPSDIAFTPSVKAIQARKGIQVQPGRREIPGLRVRKARPVPLVRLPEIWALI